MKKLMMALCTLLAVGLGEYMYALPGVEGQAHEVRRNKRVEPGRPGTSTVESGPSEGQMSDYNGSRPTTPIAQGTGGRLRSAPIKAKTVSLDPVSPVSDAVITTGPEGGYKSYADYQKEINLRDQPTDSTTGVADSFNSTANATGPNLVYEDYGDGSYGYPKRVVSKASALRLESPTSVADSSRPGSPSSPGNEGMNQSQRIGQIKDGILKTPSDGGAIRSYTPRPQTAVTQSPMTSAGFFTAQ